MITEWEAFDSAYPDEYEVLASLLTVQKEENPREVKSGLRGAIKGKLTNLIEVDDGRFFLDALYGIKSTTQLSQARGVVLGAWLRSDLAEQLPHLVAVLKTFINSQQPDPVVQAAMEMGAEVKELTEEPEQDAAEVVFEISNTLRQLVEHTEEFDFQGMPEAPASVNFFASLNGYNAQWTLRAWNEADLLVRAYGLLSGLTKLGAYPVDRYGNPITTINNVAVAAESTSTQQQPRRTGMKTEPPPNVPLAAGEQALRVGKIRVGTNAKKEANLEFFGPTDQWPRLWFNFGNSSFLQQFPEMRGDHSENPQLFEDDDLMPSIEDGQVLYPEYTGNWIAVWKESEKLNREGNPYKNIVSIKPA